MQVWKLYKTQGNKVERNNQFCPKCGDGVFLSAHKDREVCGKCNYSNFKK